MRFKTLCLDFVVQGGIVFPRDPELHRLAVLFAENELSQPINFANFNKILCVCEVDEDDRPIRVVGMTCGQDVPDWPVLRYTNPEAGRMLFERMRSYLQDRGYSGGSCFVHVAYREPDEARCPEWKEMLKEQKATNASRWAVKV